MSYPAELNEARCSRSGGQCSSRGQGNPPGARPEQAQPLSKHGITELQRPLDKLPRVAADLVGGVAAIQPVQFSNMVRCFKPTHD